MKVITSRHGVPRWKSRGDIGTRGGRGRVGWWKRVTALIEGEEGKWFWGMAEQRLRDGGTAGFWDGAWAGEKSLKERFPHLF